MISEKSPSNSRARQTAFTVPSKGVARRASIDETVWKDDVETFVAIIMNSLIPVKISILNDFVELVEEFLEKWRAVSLSRLPIPHVDLRLSYDMSIDWPF